MKIAIAQNNPELVYLLLSKCPDIHIYDSNGKNLLMWAVEQNNPELIAVTTGNRY
jgi:ankyrin repeat protein